MTARHCRWLSPIILYFSPMSPLYSPYTSTELSSQLYSDHTLPASDAEYEALMTKLEGMRSARQVSRLTEPAFLRYRLSERKRAVNEILEKRGISLGSDTEAPAFLRKYEALQAVSQYDEAIPQEIRDRM